MSERSCRNCQYQCVCRAHIGHGKWLAEICNTYQHRYDREALLAVAETLEDCAGRGSDLTALGCSCLAKRIREACGEVVK